MSPYLYIGYVSPSVGEASFSCKVSPKFENHLIVLWQFGEVGLFTAAPIGSTEYSYLPLRETPAITEWETSLLSKIFRH